jgi:hypothetical protein
MKTWHIALVVASFLLGWLLGPNFFNPLERALDPDSDGFYYKMGKLNSSFYEEDSLGNRGSRSSQQDQQDQQDQQAQNKAVEFGQEQVTDQSKGSKKFRRTHFRESFPRSSFLRPGQKSLIKGGVQNSYDKNNKKNQNSKNNQNQELPTLKFIDPKSGEVKVTGTGTGAKKGNSQGSPQSQNTPSNQKNPNSQDSTQAQKGQSAHNQNSGNNANNAHNSQDRSQQNQISSNQRTQESQRRQQDQDQDAERWLQQGGGHSVGLLVGSNFGQDNLYGRNQNRDSQAVSGLRGQNVLSESQWLGLVFHDPSFSNGKNFFNAYQRGEISYDTFLKAVETLSFHSKEAYKQLGVYLLSLEVSRPFFVILFELTQKDPSIQSALGLVLTNYQSTRGVQTLLPLLNPETEGTLVEFTLQQIYQGLLSGAVSNHLVNQNYRVKSFNQLKIPDRNLGTRREILRQENHTGFYSIILKALSSLESHPQLSEQGRSLVQNLEFKLQDSRIAVTE